MKRLIVLAAILFGAGQLFAQTTTGEVVGSVIDSYKKPLTDFHVFIDDVMGQRYQTKTDFDGRFRISGIPSGQYTLNVRRDFDTLKMTGVKVPTDGIFNAGDIVFAREVDSILEQEVVIVIAPVRLISGDLPAPTLDAEQIQQSSQKFNIKSMVTTMSSEVRMSDDGELVFRGARKGDMIYLVDGVKMRDAGSLPSAAIGRMTLYTGGLPAKYGDTLGGVVVLETQSYFDLYRNWQAQQLKAGK